MSEPHNHHYVPQTYLRSFADGVGRKARVFTADLMTGRSFVTLVRNVAAQRDFNRIETNEHNPNALEQAYSIFESTAAAALQRIIESQAFTDAGDRRVIMNLMALLVVRHPNVRSKIGKLMEDIGQAMMEAATGTKERWRNSVAEMNGVAPAEITDEQLGYEEMRRFVRTKAARAKLHQNVHIGLEIESIDPLLEMLMVRKWVLHIAHDEASQFITSDRPCFLIDLEPKPGLFSAGYGMAKTAVIFPLSPRLAISGTFEGKEEVRLMNAQGVASMNAEIARHSRRQVYAKSIEFRYLSKGAIKSGNGLSADPAFRKRGS